MWEAPNDEIADGHFYDDAGAKAGNCLTPVFEDTEKQVSND